MARLMGSAERGVQASRHRQVGAIPALVREQPCVLTSGPLAHRSPYSPTVIFIFQPSVDEKTTLRGCGSRHVTRRGSPEAGGISTLRRLDVDTTDLTFGVMEDRRAIFHGRKEILYLRLEKGSYVND